MNAIDSLKHDAKSLGFAVPSEEWQSLSAEFTACRFPTGDVILSSVRVADRWLFVTRGIVAFEQTSPDGGTLIGRFFQPGQFCSNLESAWRQELASDTLIAITNVEGVLLPDPVFRDQYLRGGVFGQYLRIKAMETLILDKDILCAKTSNDTEVQYSFLERSFPEVVQRATQKDVARFIGVTPQGLNRFLRNRKSSSARAG